jgi:hypothetical protein
MSFIATLMILVATVGFLTKSNRVKSRKIKSLEKTLNDKIFECEQLEQMLIRYNGRQQKK